MVLGGRKLFAKRASIAVFFCLIWNFTVVCTADPVPAPGQDKQSTGLPTQANASFPADELDGAPDLVHGAGESSKILYIKFKNGTTYSLPDEPLTPDQKALFNLLSAEEKALFQTRRARYLKGLAWIMKLGYPFYKYLGPVVRPFAPLLQAPVALVKWATLKVVGRKLRKITSDVEKEELAENAPEPNPTSVSKKLNARERYHRIVQSLLRSVDQELWSSSHALAKGNEFRLIMQLGGGGGAGVGDGKTTRGGHLGTGTNLALCFDWKGKRLSFLVFKDLETLKKVVGVYAGANAFVSFEAGWASHGVNDTLKMEKGVSIIPPGPFMGVSTSHSFQMGFGLGPNLFGVNLPVPSHVEHELERANLFRFSLGLTWPYIQVKLGKEPAAELGRRTLRVVKSTCTYVLSLVKGKIF